MVYTQDKNLKYTSMASVHPDFRFSKMVGKTDADFFSREDAAKLEKIKKKVLKTGKPIRQNIALTIDTAHRSFDLLIRPVYDNGQIAGIACTSTDITELTETEKELATVKKRTNGK